MGLELESEVLFVSKTSELFMQSSEWLPVPEALTDLDMYSSNIGVTNRLFDTSDLTLSDSANESDASSNFLRVTGVCCEGERCSSGGSDGYCPSSGDGGGM